MIIKVKNVGEFCKLFRMNILKISLKEMEQLTGVKVSTLSSFENSRSSNIEHINLYLSLCNREQALYFRKHIPFKIG